MRALWLVLLLAACCLLASAGGVRAQQNILSFGAVPDDDSAAAAQANTNALVKAFEAASAAGLRARRGAAVDLEARWNAVLDHSRASYEPEFTQSASSLARLFPLSPEQTVLVPANSSFTIGWTVVSNVSDVVLQIDGTLVVSGNTTFWDGAGNGDFGVLQFEDCEAVTIQGKVQTYAAEAAAAEPTLAGAVESEGGVVEPPLPTSAPDIDGQGYDWWVRVLEGQFDHRPHLVYLVRCRGFSVIGTFVRNSPQYHFLTSDCADLYWKNTTIHVDVDKQNELVQAAGYAPFPRSRAEAQERHKALLLEQESGLSSSLPTFPLNTDGIDPSAERVLIEDFFITNFDDAIAVKPCQERDSKFCPCAADMLARNGFVTYSVGLTIGSVPPSPMGHCVRNITFTSVDMRLPFKALYIKTNPGIEGTGSIEQIEYSNIRVDTPLWYFAWIGPQQQKQPANGTDTGCSFLYPLNTTCATQPLVSIRDVTLRNITATGGITLPGVLLCDPKNPCTGIRFDGVDVQGSWFVQNDYVCINVQGTQSNASPSLACLTGDHAKGFAEQQQQPHRRRHHSKHQQRMASDIALVDVATA